MRVWAANHKDGKMEHCRQYARQRGISIEEAMTVYGLESPEPPEGCEDVWDWFFELSGSRTSNGFGANPISWAEMDAWSRMTGIKMTPWLARCFRAMDNQWLSVMNEKPKAATGMGNARSKH